MKTISIPVDELTGKPQISNEMKAAFIGEFSWKEQADYYDEDGDLIEHTATRIVPWDLCKDIYKAMAMEAAKGVQP